MAPRNFSLSIFVILLAAAVMSFGSGCASLKLLTLSKQERLMLNSFRQQIHETVSDPTRAQQLIDLGENLSIELHDYLDKMAMVVKKYNKATADYDTTPEKLNAYFLELNSNRRDMREILLRAHVQVVQLTTESEWAKLTSRKKTLLDFMEKHPELF